MPTAMIAIASRPLRLLGHRLDRGDGPIDRGLGDVAGLVDALAEPRDLGAVTTGLHGSPAPAP